MEVQWITCPVHQVQWMTCPVIKGVTQGQIEKRPSFRLSRHHEFSLGFVSIFRPQHWARLPREGKKKKKKKKKKRIAKVVHT
ncbi:uncharacterized protein LAJ45_02796 [Morchella importuna]|uniref:uncharacterized protein n=1 Tax=Morchella importuna TaxID=1174673 RepID=UPI001E8CA62C|nr:uncharacterized protein LAJ45_02796 [Morchella importuna]KAH8153209.1 hypothetical protein LAJ45_02796 [Morchella importuna]